MKRAAERKILSEFREAFGFCWACSGHDRSPGAFELDYPRHLLIHHILKPGRIHADWNLARLCALCHDLAEGHRIVRISNGRRFSLPRLTLANILWLKREHDREHYDRTELQKHTRAGRRLPRIAKPHYLFLNEHASRITEAVESAP